MKGPDKACPRCGRCAATYLCRKNTNVGAYCAVCHYWIAWVSQTPEILVAYPRPDKRPKIETMDLFQDGPAGDAYDRGGMS